MKKEITICFRTSEDLRNALEAVARGDRRSLSSVIELILTDHVKKNRDSPEGDQRERRRYPRRHVAIPAYVKVHGSAHGAVIVDLSLGGMRVSVPSECVSGIYEGPEKSHFETSFALPSGGTVKVVCKPERIAPSNGNVDVGACFVEADFVNYQRIQQYLM